MKRGSRSAAALTLACLASILALAFGLLCYVRRRSEEQMYIDFLREEYMASYTVKGYAWPQTLAGVPGYLATMKGGDGSGTYRGYIFRINDEARPTLIIRDLEDVRHSYPRKYRSFSVSFHWFMGRELLVGTVRALRVGGPDRMKP